ncbi:MAG: hypothetical protein DMG59_28860 [Acidobacteria bacterium]|nr:MAG: hypothetical protein DMG59_28860 [Acidobacteriota bacterium]
MAGFRFRLTSDGFAVSTNGKIHSVTIPAGSTVTVTSGPFDGIRLVDVEWEGQSLMMFTAELREQGYKLACEGVPSPK